MRPQIEAGEGVCAERSQTGPSTLGPEDLGTRAVRLVVTAGISPERAIDDAIAPIKESLRESERMSLRAASEG